MNFEGFFDICDLHMLLGWVMNKDRDDQVVNVDIYDFDQLIVTIPANLFREGLVEHGKGTGYHAFQYPVPWYLKDGKEHLISVKVSGTNMHLIGSPKILKYDIVTKKRIEVARDYLHGVGIEIGALHSPLPVRSLEGIDSIKYIDRMDKESLRRYYPELSNYDFVIVDIVEDGEKLTKIDDNSLDFIICNHMLEHCEDPIGTIKNFMQKLKDNGMVYLVIPDKRFCFDKNRELTLFEHCVQDHLQGPEISRYNHYLEWAKLVNKIPEEEVISQANEYMEKELNIHFHVWDYHSFYEFLVKTIEYLNNSFSIEKFEQNITEIITILKKVD
ncbi:methyltransferase domain-containing protein [Bacillus sp. JJ1127]|uniref:methyltransferase domain-containing protein n=1 Tax=Bacillus sp. JJ1127 TaxID=3122952 RepID=UPI002FFD6453